MCKIPLKFINHLYLLYLRCDDFLANLNIDSQFKIIIYNIKKLTIGENINYLENYKI